MGDPADWQPGVFAPRSPDHPPLSPLLPVGPGCCPHQMSVGFHTGTILTPGIMWRASRNTAHRPGTIPTCRLQPAPLTTCISAFAHLHMVTTSCRAVVEEGGHVPPGCIRRQLKCSNAKGSVNQHHSGLNNMRVDQSGMGQAERRAASCPAGLPNTGGLHRSAPKTIGTATVRPRRLRVLRVPRQPHAAP